jgi:hypothetical protein
VIQPDDITSGSKRKSRYGFEDILMPRRVPRSGRLRQLVFAGETLTEPLLSRERDGATALDEV